MNKFDVVPADFRFDEYWCEFNRAEEFSLGPNGAYGGISSATLAAQSIPSPTDPALLTKLDGDTGVNSTDYASTLEAPTGANVRALSHWWRNNIGTPTNIHFWSDRALGTDNELHTSVKMGCQDTNHGFSAYNPYVSIGISTGSIQKRIHFACRMRKQPSGNTGGAFVGFCQQLLTPGAPLTTAGVAATGANDTYFGFRLATDNRLHFVMNDSNVSQKTIDTGVDLSSQFLRMDIVADMQNDVGGSWVGGYADAYLDGKKILEQSGRIRTVLPTEVAWSPSVEPLSLSMAVVKTAGNSAPLIQVDAIGARFTRSVPQTGY